MSDEHLQGYTKVGFKSLPIERIEELEQKAAAFDWIFKKEHKLTYNLLGQYVLSVFYKNKGWVTYTESEPLNCIKKAMESESEK